MENPDNEIVEAVNLEVSDLQEHVDIQIVPLKWEKLTGLDTYMAETPFKVFVIERSCDIWRANFPDKDIWDKFFSLEDAQKATEERYISDCAKMISVTARATATPSIKL